MGWFDPNSEDLESKFQMKYLLDKKFIVYILQVIDIASSLYYNKSSARYVVQIISSFSFLHILYQTKYIFTPLYISNKLLFLRLTNFLVLQFAPLIHIIIDQMIPGVVPHHYTHYPSPHLHWKLFCAIIVVVWTITQITQKIQNHFLALCRHRRGIDVPYYHKKSHCFGTTISWLLFPLLCIHIVPTKVLGEVIGYYN